MSQIGSVRKSSVNAQYNIKIKFISLLSLMFQLELKVDFYQIQIKNCKMTEIMNSSCKYLNTNYKKFTQ